MPQPVISADDFDQRAAEVGRVNDKGLAVARAVLVEGRGPTEVAREHGVSKQYVDKCAKKVRAGLEGVPADWERVEAWFPPDVAKTVRAMAQVALEQHQAAKA